VYKFTISASLVKFVQVAPRSLFTAAGVAPALASSLRRAEWLVAALPISLQLCIADGAVLPGHCGCAMTAYERDGSRALVVWR
jgi:hypothetical protein